MTVRLEITHLTIPRSVSDFSFSDKNPRIVIRGPSGCGKSTLLKAVAGLLPTDHGEIRINDKTFDEIGLLWRSSCLYVPQTPPQMSGTPLDLVSMINGFQVQKSHMGDKELKHKEFGLRLGLRLSMKWNENWNSLSGGESQRMLLAIALSRNPDIILLDEPTSALDQDSKFKMESLLRDYSYLWVTHDSDQEKRINAKHRLSFYEGGEHIIESI